MSKQQNSLPPDLRAIWTDLYTLHTNFNDMGNTVDDWEIWWRTAGSIVHKHNNSKLAMELVLGLSAYLEHERKIKAKEDTEVS